jgi:hypothetical protein
MNRNVATWDRIARALGAAAMLVCSAIAPFSILVRVLLLALPGLYLLGTVLFGRCLGYRLLGWSTCKAAR